MRGQQMKQQIGEVKVESYSVDLYHVFTAL